jgi:hypothetical protein
MTSTNNNRARWYYGELIDRCNPNPSGMRWICLLDTGGFLRADTLDGLKGLIRHDRIRRGLPVRGA